VGLLGGNRHEEIRAWAELLAATGRGRELMLVPGWWHVISAESYLDRLDNLPKLLDAAQRIRCPTLFVRGDREPEAVYPVAEFQQLCAGPCDVAVIENADHFYNGAEDAVIATVCGWLDSKLSSVRNDSL